MTTITNLDEKVFAPPIERRKFRVDEYQKMTQLGILPEESGWEIINGEVIRRMSIGSQHAGTVKRFSELIRDVIGKTAIISVQDPIHLDDYNEPEPDVALLKRRSDFYTESHPAPADILVVIEVSDSTIRYDREVKQILYAEHNISEFWLVDLTAKTIEIHTQPRRGIYHRRQIFGTDEVLQSTTIESLTLDVNQILGL